MKSFRFLLAAASVFLVSTLYAADQAPPGATLDVTQLPAPVQATLQREGARVDKVEQETEGGKTFYEATLSKAGKNYSVHVGSDGKIIKREGMADEQQK